MTTRPVDHSLLAITGYTDRLSVCPGESVSIHASSTEESGSMTLIRLGHDGDTFTKESVSPPMPIELSHREVVLGSYGLVYRVEFPAAPICVHAWIWMSLDPRSPNGEAKLLATEGLELVIDAANKVVFTVGGRSVKSANALRLRRWYQVGGGLCADGRPFVFVRPMRPEFEEERIDRVVGTEEYTWESHVGTMVIGCGFDGKMEDVCVGRAGRDDLSDAVLRVDFARGISTWLLYDDRGTEVGRVVGLPMRGVAGRNWDGSEYDWRHAPDHYAAIHFHTDDQGDQQWPTTAALKVPDDLPVGIYAAELIAGSYVDHLPIIVRRRYGRPAPLLLLLPTLTYLAYALEHTPDDHIERAVGWKSKIWERCAEFARVNGFHSLYDMHADGAPVVLGSLHRPLLNTRPDHRYRLFGCEHNFSADLHLVGWLTRQGLPFDVATDHDLDSEGIDLLAPYRGVMTGNHPEYWSARMLSALDRYLDTGGSLAYLGGNGFWWTTVIDRTDPSIVEMRRGYAWGGPAGEGNFQLNGLPAGLWSACGRQPGAMVGVTWACTGMEDGVPYRRTPASYDSRVAHLFAGIGDQEVIGERGAFLGAAASIEVDSAHPLLGTPAHALVVATAVMPSGYRGSPVPAFSEEREGTRRQADIIYFEARGGGAVFSVGSMGWIGALSQDRDRNAASRLTANVLRAFAEGGR